MAGRFISVLVYPPGATTRFLELVGLLRAGDAGHAKNQFTHFLGAETGATTRDNQQQAQCKRLPDSRRSVHGKRVLYLNNEFNRSSGLAAWRPKDQHRPLPEIVADAGTNVQMGA